MTGRRTTLGMLLGIALMLGLVVAPAMADHDEQGLEAHCLDHNGHEGKVEASGNPASAEETITIDGVEVTVTIDGKTVSFTDDEGNPIDVIFCMKAGDLAGGDEEGSSGSVSWINHGGNTPDISYVIVYGFPTPVTELEQVDIDLLKEWFDADGDPTDAPAGSFVTLQSGEESINEGESMELDEGSEYSVSENLPEGWEEVDCDGLTETSSIATGTGEGFTADESGTHLVCNQAEPVTPTVTPTPTTTPTPTETPTTGVLPSEETAPTTTTTAQQPETAVLAEAEVRPDGVPAGSGGFLPSTGAAGLLLLMLAGLGLTLGGILFRRTSIE
jgi:hypothetical protein